MTLSLQDRGQNPESSSWQRALNCAFDELKLLSNFLLPFYLCFGFCLGLTEWMLPLDLSNQLLFRSMNHRCHHDSLSFVSFDRDTAMHPLLVCCPSWHRPCVTFACPCQCYCQCQYQCQNAIQCHPIPVQWKLPNCQFPLLATFRSCTTRWHPVSQVAHPLLFSASQSGTTKQAASLHLHVEYGYELVPYRDTAGNLKAFSFMAFAVKCFLLFFQCASNEFRRPV